MFIRSERLFLRPGWAEDWEEVLAGIGDEGVIRNLARAPWPYTGEHARSFLLGEQDPQVPHFLVTLPGAGGTRVIGGVGFARDGEEIELGYWIARAHWGRGYATEAARAALRIARTLGHRRVVASHFVDNPASGQVLRKLGFVPTGEILPRFSLSRGTSDPSARFVRELGKPSDCDGGDMGGDRLVAA